MFKKTKTFPKLSPVIQGISFFYFLGAYVITLLPAMAKNDLNGSEKLVSWMFAIFSVGIACGAIYYDRISKKEIRLQPMFFSIFAMTFFLLVMAILLSFHSDASWVFYGILATFFGVSFFSGIYSTPLYALLQKIPSEQWRSQAIATNNVANSFYILLAAVIMMGFYALGISHAMMFVFVALFWISTLLYLVPHFPVPFYRLVLYCLLRSFYKLKIKNWEKFPVKGPYVIISNHISFIDWVFLGYLTEKHFSFVVWYKYYFFPGMNIFFRQVNAIPIAGRKEDVKILEESFPKMVQVLKDGDFLFLFPEGSVSRTGEMDFFRPGVIEVLKQFPVPVIPVKLNNLWGSIFSRCPEKYALNNVLKKIRPEIEIIVGDPIVVTHDKEGLLKLENAVKNLS